MKPIYPIYIPSKGRADRCLTANALIRDDVPFRLVIESQERDIYQEIYGDDCLLILPFSNVGSVIPARNWIKEHAISEGHYRHWQLDDNLRMFYRLYQGKRIPCNAGYALGITEKFVDRYKNIAIAGLNYAMFGVGKLKPFTLNCHVYSCTLILNEIPHKWRGRYNEDTDICLQVLADGWCTVLINVFLAAKIATMIMRGGNTDALSYHDDGRRKMARALERRWPGVVKTGRRFQRPQHIVHSSWRKFDTPLQLRDDIDLSKLPTVDEHGLELKQVSTIESPEIGKLYRDYKRKKLDE